MDTTSVIANYFAGVVTLNFDQAMEAQSLLQEYAYDKGVADVVTIEVIQTKTYIPYKIRLTDTTGTIETMECGTPDAIKYFKCNIDVLAILLD